VPKVKLLGGGIEMMELQGLLTAEVAAQRAPSTGLLDQLALDRATSFRDSFGAAANTAVVPATLQHELGVSMRPTPHGGSVRLSARSVTPPIRRLQTVLRHPVPHGRHAPIESLRDLTQGQAFLDACLQLGFGDPAFGRVTVCIASHHPVLLQPVTHRARMLADFISDCFQ
jgi:hypothetical protein